MVRRHQLDREQNADGVYAYKEHSNNEPDPFIDGIKRRDK